MDPYETICITYAAYCRWLIKQNLFQDINESNTKEILDHHWVAFQANDLEATMEDYTEKSILITPDRTYRGLSEIRENFVAAFAAFPKDSSTLVLDKSVAVNDVGYILWHAKTPVFTLSFATDTFTIQNGKIVTAGRPPRPAGA